MKTRLARLSCRRCFITGTSLVEVMVALAIASLVLAGVMSLVMFSARSSAAVNNYTDLDSKSRYALDVIGREILGSTVVVAFQTNPPIKSLTLTNADDRTLVTVTYDANDRTVIVSKTGHDDLLALTECDRFDFALYQRTPYITPTNVFYFPATNTAGVFDLGLCKLISLSWKCSRTIFKAKVNTESVQAAQLVLRNKQ